MPVSSFEFASSLEFVSSPEFVFSPDDTDLAACRALMRGGSKTFFAAAHLLPRSVRDPATALYAFCRLADDAIDEHGDTLASLHERLDRAYAGRPCAHPADRAFSTMVRTHHLPHALPAALLEGFAWDTQARRYASLEDLLDYAARVAGSVGAMMAVLMGVHDPDALARACDLGVAMQLTNIARDVGEDARASRLYLPLDWLGESGVDVDALLADPQPDARLASVIARLLDVAETLYARGRTGVGVLPVGCRPGIQAAARIYAEIGRTLERSGHDITRRARVPARRKLVLLAASLPALLASAPRITAPALPACQFLVDAAARDTPARPALSPSQAIGARLTWTFDLFQRLHDQQWAA